MDGDVRPEKENVMKHTLALLLMSALSFSGCAARAAAVRAAQDPPELWQAYARKLPIGSAVTVRTIGGYRLRATLLAVDATGIAVRPDVRDANDPTPIAHVAFDQLDQLELHANGAGPAAEAGAIAAGAGVGFAVFMGLLLLALMHD
jgi:hypothetical protein